MDDGGGGTHNDEMENKTNCTEPLLKLIILQIVLNHYVIYLLSFGLFVDEKYRISIHFKCTVQYRKIESALQKQQKLQIDKLNWWMFFFHSVFCLKANLLHKSLY